MALYSWCLRRPRRVRGLARSCSAPCALRPVFRCAINCPPPIARRRATSDGPLCPPWILPLPLRTFRASALGLVYGAIVDVILGRCFLCVADAHTEARCPPTAFRAHFNLWWARLGWPLIHPVARAQSRFSRPPYLTVAVNLTAESVLEPPWGGEICAGEN